MLTMHLFELYNHEYGALIKEDFKYSFHILESYIGLIVPIVFDSNSEINDKEVIRYNKYRSCCMDSGLFYYN